MASGRNRNRVLDNRMWDDAGLEWEREYRWLSGQDIERHLDAAARVVVHGFGQPLRWLGAHEARAYWNRICPFTQVDDSPSAVEPDGDGLTYAAVEWRRGGERLLGFEEFC